MADFEGASPGSTIEHSEVDERMTTQASSPVRADPRTSLQHVLGDPESYANTPTAFRQGDLTEDEESRTPAPQPELTKPARKKRDGAAQLLANPGGPGSGLKIKHLKKDDGEPLWRKDIQFEFLKAIFYDDKAVFTNSYDLNGPPAPLQTFSQLYIDAMARSSKTSKILRDKLLTEHEPARNMAMVCLLVNLGRMNTTLNFFPEMRAQLRTYHAIPSLQAHQDPNSYKQLQDAPRLKSILKGASEDRPEPNTLDKIKERLVPRTNPVNLIFVLAQFAPKITDLHFPPGVDFFDLIMRTNISSETRATAFLWLMWFYLESDFTEEGADENPFGPGIDYQTGVRNQGVPVFTHLDPDEEEAENRDTPEEQKFGYTKMRERKRIIEADQAAFQTEIGPPKRGPKPKLHLPPEDGAPSSAAVNRLRDQQDLGLSPASVIRMRPKYESDMDSTRSTPPPRGMGVGGIRNSVLSKGRGGRFMESSPATGGGDAPSVTRRSRPLTAHQIAVERNRNQRVDYILSRGIKKSHHKSKKTRRKDGIFWRARQRMNMAEDPFEDSEGDESLGKAKDRLIFRENGFIGLVQLENEEDDFGEEFASYAAAFRRMGRRLARWDKEHNPDVGVMSTARKVQQPTNGYGRQKSHENELSGHRPLVPKPSADRDHKRNRGDLEREEDLDDMDKTLLGIASDNEDEESGREEEELDDVDKALLGIAGEEADSNDDSDDGMDVD